MNQERRSQTSIGAQMRNAAGWGSWGAPNAAATVTQAPTARRVLLAGATSSRKARREALTTFDLEIVEASSTSEALNAVRQNDFALILVDTGAADLGELELGARLRLEPRAQGVPVIFIIAPECGPDRVHSAYEIGAFDCLTDAPLDTAVLRHKACICFEMHSARIALQAAAAQAKVQQHELDGVTLQLQERHAVLSRQSTHDLLTGLPNQLLFEDRLDGALKRARRNRQHVALAFINLDGFKRINEEHGYNAGDELITITSKRLLHAVRTSDTVARLGADEFAVVLESLHNAAAADYLAHKMARAVVQPCTVLADPHGTPVEVAPTAGIGLAVFPDHAREREELVTAAGMTLQQVKESGGGVLVYSGGVLVGSESATSAGVGRIAGVRKG